MPDDIIYEELSETDVFETVVAKAMANGYEPPDKFPDLHADIQHVIFSHDFAKAFWGEELHQFQNPAIDETLLPMWKYHLQALVLTQDHLRMKYLHKFL